VRHMLEREQIIPKSRVEVFSFFSEAVNLEQLTPHSLNFRICNAFPIEMRAGALIDYQISLFGVPFQWCTLIEEFESESLFVDLQLRGPYRYWRHRHEFRDVPGGTMVRDCVEYELPFGLLGEFVHSVFVKKQLDAIFDFRNQRMKAVFGVKSVLDPDISVASPGVFYEHV
jgi:ligand-binding SRPBCC domain-containing protein